MPDAPPSPLRRVFGANVRNRRKALNLSQEELADLAGVHRTYMGAVERAEKNVSIDNMDRISTAVGTTAAELLRED